MKGVLPGPSQNEEIFEKPAAARSHVQRKEREMRGTPPFPGKPAQDKAPKQEAAISTHLLSTRSHVTPALSLAPPPFMPGGQAGAL